jgi:3-oxoacyl-[acyl-carrier-protein] synthase-3
MQTDSERLLRAGIAAGAATFDGFLNETGWTRRDIHKTYCHQVGSAHRKLLLDALSLDPARDYATFETLGNTGSAALPITFALAIECGHLQPREHAALLGIGSGINVLMLGVDWQTSLIRPAPEPRAAVRQRAGTSTSR